jgi:hypothetical protein
LSELPNLKTGDKKNISTIPSSKITLPKNIKTAKMIENLINHFVETSIWVTEISLPFVSTELKNLTFRIWIF